MEDTPRTLRRRQEQTVVQQSKELKQKYIYTSSCIDYRRLEQLIQESHKAPRFVVISSMLTSGKTRYSNSFEDGIGHDETISKCIYGEKE